MKNERYENPCEHCALDDTCVGLETIGPSGAKILVVTKAPRKGATHPLSPQAQGFFAKAMAKYGFKRSDFVFHASVLGVYDPALFQTKEKHSITRSCREYLLRVIEQMKPDIIIPLGNDAASAVMGRKVAITKARGVPVFHEQHDTWVLPMLDPEFVAMYPQHRPSFNIDCKALRQLIDNDFDVEQIGKDALGEYEIVDDLQFLIDLDPSYLSFDVETVGPKHVARGSKILTMQFSVEPGKGYMVVWDHPERPFPYEQRRRMLHQLRQLLCDPKREIIGQNLKYDAVWMLSKLGIRIRIWHDTLMYYTLLDENSNDKNMDMLVKLFVPSMAGYADAFNQKYDKSRMDLVPLDDLLPYGCGDTDACLQLFHALRPRIEADWKLMAHYERVSRPALNAFVPIEAEGMIVSEDNLDAFQETLDASVKEQRANVIGQIPRPISQKWVRMHGADGLNFDRRPFIRDILFEPPYGHRAGLNLTPRVWTKSTEKLADDKKLPSTSTKDHLPFFYEHQTHGQFVMDLGQLLKDQRLLNTNVVSFREKYLYEGRIYPIYSLTTAVTGRSASRDPNGQNFPKRGKNAKAYRAIFVPPPGWVLLEADLSQAELRIAADMADETTMLEIYRQGGDIHKRTAMMVMGITEEQFKRLPKDEQKLARFKAKAVNFGYIYGMGWRKFIVYAKTQYGVDYTPDEAERIRNGFFDLYSGLQPWHRAMRNYAKRHKQVRSYSGRIRHLPMIDSAEEWIQSEAERQAINSPVQEFGSSLGLMSMGRIDQEIDRKYLKLVGFVHDALYAYVPAKFAEWGAKVLKEYMESNDITGWFGKEMACPILSEVGFGFDGSEMFEMGGLKLGKRYDWEGEIYDSKDWKESGLERLPAQKRPPNNGRIQIAEYLDLGLAA